MQPFCADVEGAVQQVLIPLEGQNLINSVDLSSLLSMLKLPTVFLVFHSANNTHSFKALMTDDLSARRMV